MAEAHPAGPGSAPEHGAAEPPSVQLVEVRPSLGETLALAWESRHLLWPMAARVVGAMYQGTKLGRGWFVLRPGADILAKLLLFGGVLGVSGGDAPYLLVLLAALLSWRLLERALFWGTRSFDRYRRLMRKVEIPLLMVPIGAFGPALVEGMVYLCFAALALVAYLAIDGHLYLQAPPGLLLALGGLLMPLLLALALSLWTSVLNARARDVRYLLRYVLQFWLYLTPVVYPLAELPSGLQTVALLNPMTPPVEMVKEGLMGAGRVETWSVLWSASVILVLLLVGLWYFSRSASAFDALSGDADPEEDDLPA